MGSLLGEGNGFRHALLKAVGTGELEAANSEQSIQVMAQGYIFGFSGLLLHWKERQTLGKLSIIYYSGPGHLV